MSEPPFVFERSSKVTLRRGKSSQDLDRLNNLFPFSLVHEVPNEYEVPEGYLQSTFWNGIIEKLEEWHRQWLNFQLRIRRDVYKSKSQTRCEQGNNIITPLTESYRALLAACWKGSRENPPLPLETFEKLWDELKLMDSEVCTVCEALGFPITFSTFPSPKEETRSSVEPRSSQVAKYDSKEKFENLKKQLESFSKDGPLVAYIAQNVLSLCTYISKVADDVDVEEQEDTLPILVEMLEKYRKTLAPDCYAEIKEAIDNLDDECSNKLVPGIEYTYQCLPATLEELREIVLSGNTPIRRSQREKKPIKLEPVQEEARERSAKRLKVKEEVAVMEKEEKRARGRPKREAKPVKIYTPPHDHNEADDESDQMEELVLIDSPRHERRAKRRSSLERHPREPASKVKKNEEAPSIPDDKVTEKEIMVMNERVFLETTRLHLLSLKYPDGRFAMSFIPAILESIARAVASLGELAMIDYINPTGYLMHKAAVEVGVCQLIKDLRARSRPKSSKDGPNDKIEQRSLSTKSDADIQGESSRELELTQL